MKRDQVPKKILAKQHDAIYNEYILFGPLAQLVRAPGS